jgi:hypothetical protein
MSKSSTSSNGQATPAARIGYADLKWWEMDTLRGGADDTTVEELIAVTPRKPSRHIRREYMFIRRPHTVARLIELGFLDYVRSETYPNGHTCDVYRLSKTGRAEVEAYYGDRHAKNHARDAAYEAKRKAEERELWRHATRQLLDKQFGDDLVWPDIFQEILQSRTPFINASLPPYAPMHNGAPITIREYLLTLWTSTLSDEAQHRLTSFLRWAEVIGYEDAVLMLAEQTGTPFNFDLLDGDDETDE